MLTELKDRVADQSNALLLAAACFGALAGGCASSRSVQQVPDQPVGTKYSLKDLGVTMHVDATAHNFMSSLIGPRLHGCTLKFSEPNAYTVDVARHDQVVEGVSELPRTVTVHELHEVVNVTASGQMATFIFQPLLSSGTLTVSIVARDGGVDTVKTATQRLGD